MSVDQSPASIFPFIWGMQLGADDVIPTYILKHSDLASK